MDTLELIGSTLGIGFLAGIRLYATILGLGLAVKFNWIHLAPQSHLQVLAHPWVLGAAAVACLIEFAADKIPWLDSAWDSIHTFIRPVGAVLLASSSLGDFDPVAKVLLVILSGGLAMSSHASKAATRLAVNHSPEPFSNVALSVAGDLAAPAGLWLATKHPLEMLAFLGVFAVVFAWVSPKVYRLMRLEVTALAKMVGSWMEEGAPKIAGDSLFPAEFWGAATAEGVYAAASKNVNGLGNSIGYLSVAGGEARFTAKRMFREKTFAIPRAGIREVKWRRGFFTNEVIIQAEKEYRFLVFKTPKAEVRQSAAAHAAL